MLPTYGVFDHLSYQVEGRSVTLMGQVVRPTLKTEAERAVKSVEGVETVANQIEVLPLSGHDDRIRVLAYGAIYGTGVSRPYTLRVSPNPHPRQRR